MDQAGLMFTNVNERPEIRDARDFTLDLRANFNRHKWKNPPKKLY
jgi:hypothetical protein